MSTFRILYGGETGEGHAVFFHLFQFLFRHQEGTGIRSGCRPINSSGAENAVLSSLEIIGKHLRIHDSVQNHPPNQWFFNPPVGIIFFVIICMDQFSVFIPVVFTTDDHTVCKTAVTLKEFHTDRITVRIIFCLFHTEKRDERKGEFTSPLLSLSKKSGGSWAFSHLCGII